MAGSSGGQKRQRSEDDPELAPAEKRPRLISQESTHEFEKLRNDFQRAEISPNASDIELSNQALDSSMRAEVSDNAQSMPSALAESTAEGVTHLKQCWAVFVRFVARVQPEPTA